MLPVDPIHEEELAFIATPVLALLARFLPDRTMLSLEAWHIDDVTAALTLHVTSTQACVPCPLCHVRTSRIHSRYTRTLADLPWGAYGVRVQLQVRKFFCDHPACPRQIFTERLPTVAAPWARRTLRLAQRFLAYGLTLGGEAGARLAARLGLRISPDTLLRLVQAAPTPATSAPQSLGVDEWAWRRGHRYGTILVNLEDHQVLDLLPERSAESVATWLAQHPTITVVCRDRSALYADGIRRGAPQAVQVVDRFHLVKNLREAVEAFLHSQRPALQDAAARTAQALTLVAGPGPSTPMYRGRHRCSPVQQQRREAAQQQRHAAWVATYEAIHSLHARGTPVTTIAQQLGISRPTVYAYLRRTGPPSPRSPQRSGQVLQPYMPYVIQRWREGCTDSMQLWRELRALGYRHSARTVSRFITRLRRASEAGWAPETQTSPYTRPQGPSARAVSFTWVCPEAKRSQDAQLYVDQLRQGDQSIGQAYTLSQAFLALVRERRGDALEAWMTKAVASEIEALARFAQGLQEDLAAVKAGLTLPWSNGPVEGHINRLKLLKRQGYGRAGCALLRQRVLLPAAGGPRTQAPTTTTTARVPQHMEQGMEVGAAPMAA
ncbi:MAG TPA: ISL3 family transposase [Candidatus Tectomicrobia bacterium]